MTPAEYLASLEHAGLIQTAAALKAFEESYSSRFQQGSRGHAFSVTANTPENARSAYRNRNTTGMPVDGCLSTGKPPCFNWRQYGNQNHLPTRLALCWF